MNFEFITSNYNRIKKTLLLIIFLLLSVVLISFFYHEYLQTNIKIPEIITEFSSNQTYISYNQDYESTLIDVKNIDSFSFSLALKDYTNRDNISWSYSQDNGTSWIDIDNSSIIINKQEIKNNNLNFILVSIKDNILNEETLLQIEIPPNIVPTAFISYSTEDQTNLPVTATIISTSDITITNNNGKQTFTFDKNGEFTFEYIDNYGNNNSITAKVDWIIDNPISATIVYDINNITNKSVTATIKSDENITILNNNGNINYTFKENGEFIFEYIDQHGNKLSLPAKVNWIDRLAPKAKIAYDITDKTTEEVTAFLTNENENIIITNNEGSNSYTFKENGKFTFLFQDEAGNTSELTASVSWIEVPKNEIEENEDTPSNDTNDIPYLSKDAMSKKTTFTAKNVSVKIPTYQIKEPLTLNSKEIKVNKEIKETLGNRIEAISLSLERANRTTSNLNSHMKVSFELDPEKNFLGIYKMNNEVDIEELYYKKTDKNHIELDISGLGNYILTYAKKNLTPIKIKHTTSDLQVVILFSTSIALIVTGITVFKKSRA